MKVATTAEDQIYELLEQAEEAMTRAEISEALGMSDFTARHALGRLTQTKEVESEPRISGQRIPARYRLTRDDDRDIFPVIRKYVPAGSWRACVPPGAVVSVFSLGA